MAGTQPQKSSLRGKWPLFLVLFIVTIFLFYVGYQKKAHEPKASSAPQTQTTGHTETASSEESHPGVFYPSQGHDHWDLDKLKSFEYNSNPPTSGPHREEFIDSYFPESPLPPYIQVHLLEHGNILIQYHCSCPDWIASLKKIAQSFDTYAPSLGLEEGKGVVVAPNPNITKPIVLTAWTRLLALDSPDEVPIKGFISAWLGNIQNARQ